MNPFEEMMKAFPTATEGERILMAAAWDAALCEVAAATLPTLRTPEAPVRMAEHSQAISALHSWTGGVA